MFSDEPAAEQPPLEDDEIPELIQDTLPDLPILAPEVMAAADTVAENDDAVPTLEAHPEPLPEPELLSVAEPLAVAEPPPAEDDLPELQPLTEFPPTPQPEPRAEIAAESQADEVPAWERDPTLAQLKPDLDALEAAMALDKVAEADEVEVEVALPAAPKPAQEPTEIPEITLDNAIRERIDSNLIDEPGQISPTPSDSGPAASDSDDLPEIRLAPAKTKKADAELERIAAELAKAKTIEDVDDKMAETLFGEEINLVAAQVMASDPGAASANDGEPGMIEASAVQQSQAAGIPAGAAAHEVDATPDAHKQNGEAAGEISLSQRMRTLRAINADSRPSSMSAPDDEPDPDPVPDVPEREVEQPAPIEDQINISMTQTLKALNVQPPVLDDDESDAYDEDDEDEKKGGFFSRFRRS